MTEKSASTEWKYWVTLCSIISEITLGTLLLTLFTPPTPYKGLIILSSTGIATISVAVGYYLVRIKTMYFLSLRPDQLLALAGITWIVGLIFFMSLRSARRK